MKSVLVLLLAAAAAFGQRQRGELRLEVMDASGAGVQASCVLHSDSTETQRSFSTLPDGHYTAKELPYGLYRFEASRQGFQTYEKLVEIRSEVPVHLALRLALSSLATSVEVTSPQTLIDPSESGSVNNVGKRSLEESVSPQPGRDLLNLVAAQPGWIYEANGVLHPRESEYGIQLVVNGMPLLENRSPGFAPGLSSEEFDSVQILTAGFPAEYGRKLGGVVELTSPKDLPPGLHGTFVAGGGSFEARTGFVGLSYTEGANSFSISGDAAGSARYLDPPTTSNFNNHGTSDGFMASFARELSQQDRLQFSFTHRDSSFGVPNELVQQEAGQRQDRSGAETAGQVDYQRTLSPNLLFTASGNVRDESAGLRSNDLSTPVIVAQDRSFREGYAQVNLSGDYGNQQWKVGADGIFGAVHESLQYAITDPTQFDPGTQPNFAFEDRKLDREQAFYAQDQIHFHGWNISAGIRFDHYSLATADHAWSPRLSVSKYFPRLKLVLHASYDRVLQTPALENLLLASSPQLDSLNDAVLRLPVKPSRANYYEAGFTQALAGKMRLDVNFFRRNAKDFADDDVLLNTGVSFPIAYATAHIQGVEAKLVLPNWGRFSGWLSYANQIGVAKGPITGGLFIGSDDVASVSNSTSFPISQDQRNTARAMLRYQLNKRVWLSGSGSYSSGLPVETGELTSDDIDFLVAQYGASVLQRVNFGAGRVRPSLSLDAAIGADLWHAEKRKLSLEIAGQNLTDRLNVINFASLFSGTAIGPPRSVVAQIQFKF